MEDFVTSPAKDLFRRSPYRVQGGPVGGDDVLFRIQEKCGVADGLKDFFPIPASFPQGFLGPLALRKVPDVFNHPGDLAGGQVLQGESKELHPDGGFPEFDLL